MATAGTLCAHGTPHALCCHGVTWFLQATSPTTPTSPLCGISFWAWAPRRNAHPGCMTAPPVPTFCVGVVACTAVYIFLGAVTTSWVGGFVFGPPKIHSKIVAVGQPRVVVQRVGKGPPQIVEHLGGNDVVHRHVVGAPQHGEAGHHFPVPQQLAVLAG